MRVAVGPELEIVEVQAGEPWPAEARGKLDVLIRTGFVVRIDEHGELDRRSWPFARRIGLQSPRPYPARSFLQRARALAQFMELDGRRVRVYAGQPDGADLGLCFSGGQAYPVIRGAPDAFAAREALRLSVGGGQAAPRRRSPRKKKAKAGGQKRRRRRAEE
ncbi:MAG: hypothetical protein GY898_06135 [Proteobacteria bacterium]|nr:hypothetical protein [Pseudomonadota bacterium]